MRKCGKKMLAWPEVQSLNLSESLSKPEKFWVEKTNPQRLSQFSQFHNALSITVSETPCSG